MIRSLIAGALVLSLAGCAAIFQGSRATITTNSSPSGAKITTTPPTGEYTTPSSLSLSRKNSYSLKFELAGYTPATFEIQNHLQAGYVVADVLLTGLIGVVVDGVTGAWYGLSPEAATVTLSKADDELDGPDRIDVTIHVGKANDGETAVRVESSSRLRCV